VQQARQTHRRICARRRVVASNDKSLIAASEDKPGDGEALERDASARRHGAARGRRAYRNAGRTTTVGDRRYRYQRKFRFVRCDGISRSDIGAQAAYGDEYRGIASEIEDGCGCLRREARSIGTFILVRIGGAAVRGIPRDRQYLKRVVREAIGIAQGRFDRIAGQYSVRPRVTRKRQFQSDVDLLGRMLRTPRQDNDECK
jgi:hypothetical protein